MVITSLPGKCRVQPPSVPGASWLRSRTLANVPRTMTSWLPRRAPYELKSDGLTPRSIRYRPAGLSALMEPAGEIWSVVMLSPSNASTRAPAMSRRGAGVIVIVRSRRLFAFPIRQGPFEQA